MDNLKEFIKSYWEYYLELESQFIETKRYVEFSESNNKAFSMEYLKLYQAICSEIDVVGKEIALTINPKLDKDANISKWGYCLQKKYGSVKDKFVRFNDERDLQPFKNWEYEEYRTKEKNPKTKIRIVGGKVTIVWWRNYNDVKHKRVGLIDGTKNFKLANQKNLILALSALFLLETTYMDDKNIDKNIEYKKSRLFEVSN